MGAEMKSRDLYDLRFRLEELARCSRDVSASISRTNKNHAMKFLRMADFADGFATYLRLNEELPPDEMKAQRPAIQLAPSLPRLKG